MAIPEDWLAPSPPAPVDELAADPEGMTDDPRNEKPDADPTPSPEQRGSQEAGRRDQGADAERPSVEVPAPAGGRRGTAEGGARNG